MKINYEDSEYFDYYYGNSDLKIFNIGSYDEATAFYKSNKREVANICFIAIKKAMKYDLLEVDVFRFNIGGRLATVNLLRNDFDITLKKCIEVFEQFEEYEKCAEARDIINFDTIQKSETSK